MAVGRINLLGIGAVIGSRRPQMKDREDVIFGGAASGGIVVGVKGASQDHLADGIAPLGSAGQGRDAVLDQVQGTVIEVRTVVPVIAHVKTPVRAASQGGHVIDVRDVIDRRERKGPGLIVHGGIGQGLDVRVKQLHHRRGIGLLAGVLLPIDIGAVVAILHHQSGDRGGESRPVRGLADRREGVVLSAAAEGDDTALARGMGRVDQSGVLGPPVAESIIGIGDHEGVQHHGQVLPGDVRTPINGSAASREAARAGLGGGETITHDLVRRRGCDMVDRK